MHAIAVNENEAMNMEESRKGYKKGFGGWKEKGKM